MTRSLMRRESDLDYTKEYGHRYKGKTRSLIIRRYVKAVKEYHRARRLLEELLRSENELIVILDDDVWDLEYE